ncbi:hypothetical protein HNQ03_002124 [Chryseobacterium sp. 16F]|uniref:Uncharacterized protein n=1 Tax=Frigoriflavimonas asaccharolytica TaxID=2735899 RepID=A0A8J8G826_9FLAO|nr:hypothetical protein [Frigoriflavimonas asaccharolytica]
MCDFTQGFILSKSTQQLKIIHNKKSRKIKKENKKNDFIVFQCYLYEYLGLKIKHETGRFGRPS